VWVVGVVGTVTVFWSRARAGARARARARARVVWVAENLKFWLWGVALVAQVYAGADADLRLLLGSFRVAALGLVLVLGFSLCLALV
jgi:hypothetical protein